jgi:hypothetical protein
MGETMTKLAPLQIGRRKVLARRGLHGTSERDSIMVRDVVRMQSDA